MYVRIAPLRLTSQCCVAVVDPGHDNREDETNRHFSADGYDGVSVDDSNM